MNTDAPPAALSPVSVREGARASSSSPIKDETGIANVIITPDFFERDRVVVTRSKFTLAEGTLQNQDGVVHMKVACLQSLSGKALEISSHDFH